MNIGFDAKRAFCNKSGLGNYSRFIIRSLIKNYPDNKYYLYTPKNRNLFHSHENKDYCILRYPSTGINKYFNAYWRSFSICRQIDKDNLNVFHGLSNEIPFSLRSTKIKKIVTIHDLIFLRYPGLYPFFDRKMYYLKSLKSCQIADKIIAVSQQTKRDIAYYLNIDESKIKVIYQGCHNSFRQKFNPQRKDDIATKYNLPKNFILSVGTLERRKNQLNIIKALQLSNNNIPLILIGRKTDYYKDLEKYMIQHGVNNVFFLNFVNELDLPVIYQLASLFVYISKFEGFGIPIIEAITSGVPVLSSKEGCFTEAGGEGAVYVNPDDEEEIADGIDRLLSDTDLRKKLIEKGRDHIKKFEEKTIGKEVHNLYKHN